MRTPFRWLSASMLSAWALVVIGASSSSVPVDIAPRPFREYPSFEGADAEAPLPDDWNVPGELVVGRLMYPSARGGRGFFGGGYDWHQGGTGWTDDYPRGDRALIQMLRRNTRINVRAVEQPVSLDDGDDIFYWPFLVAGLAQSWQLSDEQAAKLRDYLERGGFLFCDSFFGEDSWASYEESLRRVFPDRDIVDLKDEEVVFHVAFELKGMTKVSIPHISQAFGRRFRSGRHSALAGRIRRFRSVDGADRPQQRRRRWLAMGRRSAVSRRRGESGATYRLERRGVCDDALITG